VSGVWLVRHGAADWPAGTTLGWSDPPLSSAGERQAAEVAELLGGRRVAVVHTSDLRRARQTAERVAARHGLPVVVSEDLRELDFGRWEGRRLADLWKEEPAQAAAWGRDIRDSPSSFGESVADLERRVGRFAAALVPGPAAEIVVVAHRGSLVVLHAALTAGDVASSWAQPFELGAALLIPWPAKEV
jgi:broad specificity phosphatase PhoE